MPPLIGWTHTQTDPWSIGDYYTAEKASLIAMANNMGYVWSGGGHLFIPQSGGDYGCKNWPIMEPVKYDPGSQ